MLLGSADAAASSYDAPPAPTCLSFCPTPIPQWARLESDTVSYTTTRGVTDIPTALVADQCINALCSRASPHRPATYHDVVNRQLFEPILLFTSWSAYEVQILDACCCSCRQPLVYDGCDDRVFRYSHRRLFSHELMNRFIADVTCSETPYHAFCTKVKRVYEGETRIPFVAQHLFMDAVATYVQLQAYRDTFWCTTCGAEAKEVICDGTMVSIPRDYSMNLSTPVKVRIRRPRIH